MREKASYDRDTRISRALRDVLPKYDIKEVIETRGSVSDLVKFRVKSKVPEKALSDYEVVVSREWKVPPSCNCPDGARRASVAGYCKHTIAVLLTNSELSCQMIELYLRDN
ncbi:MAG: SWIM zinc finger family protein [Planctomycetes bacterium]|nr:SWIM zinc finger family protein [Planctomycetota bacterium]